MRYGLPYVGSKSRFGNELIDVMPRAEWFVDLFCGGCSMTHIAISGMKYSKFLMNDLDSKNTTIFKEALEGKFRDEQRWISKEEYLRIYSSDYLVALCWSFNNDPGKHDYEYGKDIAPWKKAVWYARVFHDASLMNEMGIDSDGSKADIKKNYQEYEKKYAEWLRKRGYARWKNALEYSSAAFSSLQTLTSLQRIQKLEGICKPSQLTVTSQSYETVSLPPKDRCVVYCDIPYSTANVGYATGQTIAGQFDWERFYRWATAKSAEGYRVYISEYWMPEDRFRRIKSIEVPNIHARGKQRVQRTRDEGLFVPINQPSYGENRQYEQMSLF